MMPGKLLTVAELAESLNVSRGKVYELKEEIGFVRIGGAIRFDADTVESYLASRTFGARRLPAPSVRLPRLVHRNSP